MKCYNKSTYFNDSTLYPEYYSAKIRIQDNLRIIQLVYIVETVEVFFGLGLVQIFKVDEKSQVITLKVWEHFVSNTSHTLKPLLNETCIETSNSITDGDVMFSVLPVCPKGRGSHVTCINLFIWGL